MKLTNCLLIVVFTMCSCATDIIDYTASISGTVKDDVSGALIQNCSVSLGTIGNECVTGNDGVFSFKEVTPGNYDVVFKKTGYYDQTKPVSVVTGQDLNIAVLMKAKSPFDISESSLDFGDLNSVLLFYLYNNSDSSTSFKLSEFPSWMSVSESSGVIQGGSYTTITVNVNRDMVDYGTYEHIITISYTGKSNGSLPIHIKMSKVKLSVPSVSIQDKATDVLPQSFTLTASIDATGGSRITDYGFCWSLSPNPTITSNCMSSGSTDKTQVFTGIIHGLIPGTTYYAKAYATNECGTSYSNELVVTTKDLATDKWDGTKSSKFAGGSGTLADPYQIETGGQLLHIMDVSSAGKYFVLNNSIDLNNYNWKPVEMKGTFDGGGFTISNLKINRDEDRLGLFSIAANVKDLTIKGVQIDYNGAGAIGNGKTGVGSLAGELTVSADNVNIVLTEDSYIKGNNALYTGGLVGYLYEYNSQIENSSVISKNATYVIQGNSNVGGICGWRYPHFYVYETGIKNCHVEANICGTSSIGGIIGFGRGRITNCSYTGKIKADKYAGGLAGSLNSVSSSSDGDFEITACRVIADIEGDSYLGGFVGYSRDAYYKEVIASYFSGQVRGREYYNCFGSNDGHIPSYFLCYAAVEDGYPKYGKNNLKECAATTGEDAKEDIATYLQETYSEYCKYYNFSNIWYWEGTINGKKVRVPCPKLSWE